MIEIAGLGKSYGTVRALHDLSLRVQPGEVFGLLGPNGAGKSTAIKCAVGLLAPDTGTVRIDGHDLGTEPLAAKARLSYVPEGGNLYEALTPRELLAFRGRLFGMDEALITRRAVHLLEQLELGAWIDTPAAAFSKGMRQKTALALALLTDPQVLILDEPLTALDVNATLLIKEVLRGLARRGRTVLYSSHVLDVVERVCDRIAILKEGGLVALGSFAELRTQAGAGTTLDEVFRELTAASDPEARARALLEGL